MKIKEIIEKGVEGGWNDRPYRTPHYSKSVATWSHYESLFLDPKFWSAVGKVEGWGEYTTTHYSKLPFSEMPKWLYKMHQMIDALANGSSIEEYIATL